MPSTRKFSVLTIATIAGLFGGAVVSCFSSVRSVSASGPQVISAQKVQIVDDAGKVRGSFAVSGVAGTVALTLLSNSGEPRAVISAGADGLTAIELVHQGKLRAEMKIAAEGTPTIELWDASGKPVFMAPKNTGVTTP